MRAGFIGMSYPAEVVGSKARAACAIRSGGSARDLYLTILPDDPAAAPESAWDALASLLAEHNAALIEERVFAAPSAMSAVRRARARPMAAFDDGVAPTWLTTPPGRRGDFAGIAAHAVAGGEMPRAISAGGAPAGRRWRCGGYTLLTGAHLRAAGDTPAEQARGAFAAAEALLAAGGARLDQLSRTWLWLRDILGWYGELNRARNEVFQARGILGPNGDHRLPASTGIGVSPADGSWCALDFAADWGAPGRPLVRSARQNPAPRYGSAFSRGWVAETPFGRKVYVSGTASIGADGRSLHEGDARAQIAETLHCVRAVLAEAGFAETHIVQAIAYCKTPEVERIAVEEFTAGRSWLTVIADVCRPELLFELECVAIAPR